VPMFHCPCCGASFVVPLAFCEYLLEDRSQSGRRGAVTPAKCLDCQQDIAAGDAVTVRGGCGTSATEVRREVPPGSKGVVVGVSTWEGEGSIFLVRLDPGIELYLARAQLSSERPSTPKP